jgi:hypothetical protein
MRPEKSATAHTKIGPMYRRTSNASTYASFPCFDKIISSEDVRPLFELLRRLFERVHQILANYRIVIRLLARKYEQVCCGQEAPMADRGEEREECIPEFQGERERELY